jgi:hypothetical protein
MWKRVYVKYPLFLSDFNESWSFSTDFVENLKYEVSLKSVHWKPSCYMRTDGRTGMTKLIVAFRNFVNASKKFPYYFHALFTRNVHMRDVICSIIYNSLHYRGVCLCTDSYLKTNWLTNIVVIFSVLHIEVRGIKYNFFSLSPSPCVFR